MLYFGKPILAIFVSLSYLGHGHLDRRACSFFSCTVNSDFNSSHWHVEWNERKMSIKDFLRHEYLNISRLCHLEEDRERERKRKIEKEGEKHLIFFYPVIVCKSAGTYQASAHRASRAMYRRWYAWGIGSFVRIICMFTLQGRSSAKAHRAASRVRKRC